MPTPAHTWATHCSRIFLERRKINLSQDFTGKILGIREVDGGIGLVRFLDYAIGFFDQQENRVKPVGKSPFSLKL